MTTRIKICGMTSPEEAAFCLEAGAHAIGLVFFPKSPRHISLYQATAISRALPYEFPKVGVFVNEDEKTIMDAVDAANLTAVQLHGKESPEFAEIFLKRGLAVLKVFYMTAEPGLSCQPQFPGCTALVEWGKGTLPGGNALGWGETTQELPRSAPLVMAGGLTPENIAQTIATYRPDGVDVSSGVEKSPGTKDKDKILKLIHAVARADQLKAESGPSIKEPFSCPIQ